MRGGYLEFPFGFGPFGHRGRDFGHTMGPFGDMGDCNCHGSIPRDRPCGDRHFGRRHCGNQRPGYDQRPVLERSGDSERNADCGHQSEPRRERDGNHCHHGIPDRRCRRERPGFFGPPGRTWGFFESHHRFGPCGFRCGFEHPRQRHPFGEFGPFGPGRGPFGPGAGPFGPEHENIGPHRRPFGPRRPVPADHHFEVRCCSCERDTEESGDETERRGKQNKRKCCRNKDDSRRAEERCYSV